MLVLAMEFSRGALRTHGAAGTKEQTGGGRCTRGREAGCILDEDRRHRVGGTESPRAAHRAGSEGHSLKTE